MIKILIVDDEPETCRAIKSIFDIIDCATFVAYDAKTAIEIFEKEKPQAIFIDYYLPDLNGIQLMNKIKSIDRDNLIFFVSAAEEDEIRNEAIETGAVRFIKKPFSNREQIRACLTDNLALILKERRIPNILIADDEEDIRTYPAKFINKHIQANIVTASNGNDAFNEIQKNNFDIILLDISMDGKTGWDILQSCPGLAEKSYVFIVTGHEGYDSLAKARSFGVKDLMNKPLDLNDFFTRIKQVLVSKNLYIEKN